MDFTPADKIEVLYQTHQEALIALETMTGAPLEGITQGCRDLRKQWPVARRSEHFAKVAKKAERLDVAYHMLRHLTPARSACFITELRSLLTHLQAAHLQAPPAHLPYSPEDNGSKRLFAAIRIQASFRGARARKLPLRPRKEQQAPSPRGVQSEISPTFVATKAFWEHKCSQKKELTGTAQHDSTILVQDGLCQSDGKEHTATADLLFPDNGDAYDSFFLELGCESAHTPNVEPQVSIETIFESPQVQVQEVERNTPCFEEVSRAPLLPWRRLCSDGRDLARAIRPPQQPSIFGAPPKKPSGRFSTTRAWIERSIARWPMEARDPPSVDYRIRFGAQDLDTEAFRLAQSNNSMWVHTSLSTLGPSDSSLLWALFISG
jgi:hypothetical protein